MFPSKRASSLVLTVLAALTLAASAQAAGTRDFAYSTSASAPTGQKPQSKLWFNDGSWWGVLYSSTNKRFDIFRFNWATDTWTDTGTAVDTRARSQADVLWSGGKLYVSSNIPVGTSTTDKQSRVRRYSYDATTKTYSLDAGFPVSLVNAGVESQSLDKDSQGNLWTSYTLDQADGTRRVYVQHTVAGSQTTWAAPYVIPVTGATGLTNDDISALVTFNGKVGVMWSNENDGTMHFAVHPDGTSDATWTDFPALSGTALSDDHMNLKAINADAAGDVAAVFKTSTNDVVSSSSTLPLIYLGVYKDGAGWKKTVFGRVVDNHTRPLVLLDRENRRLYGFASSPCCSGGSIYLKSTSLDNPDLSGQVGLGTPFIQLPTDPNVNNPTSTKQELNSTTGLLVEAGDDRTHFYTHGKLALAPAATAPETTIVTGPSGTTSSRSAAFTFTSTPSGATFECALDSATFTACASGQAYSALADGVHSFQVRAKNATGTDPTPAARTWTVDGTAPAAPSITSPANGATDTDGALTVIGTAEAGASVRVRDGGAPVGTAVTAGAGGAWTVALTLADGAHTLTAVATDAAGNASPASTGVGVTVDTQAPDTAIDSGPSGTGNGPTATFAFSSPAADVASFECALDAGAYAACTSPLSLSGLADGSHTFKVRAIDTSGNADASPAIRTWTVGSGTDATPPAVTTTAPADGATGVDVATQPNATFSEDVDPASVTATSFTVTAAGSSTPVSATVSYSAPFRTAILTPASPLAAGTTYTGQVSGVRDTTGNAMTSASTWTFSTAAAPPAGGPLFSDGFESGTFSAWTTTRTGADGTATVQSSAVRTGSFAARLTGTTTPGSLAYVRKTLATAQTKLTVGGAFQVTAEGASGGNVPLLRLLDPSGTRALWLYRQNLASNTMYVAWTANGATVRGTLSTKLPLSTWARYEVRITAAGAGTSSIEVLQDGVSAFKTTTATLPAAGISTLQVGNETAAQAFGLLADDVSVQTP